MNSYGLIPGFIAFNETGDFLFFYWKCMLNFFKRSDCNEYDIWLFQQSRHTGEVF
jgi:hypothetical protein